MDETEFNWVEKKLPVSHFLVSGFFIVIQILALVHWILFIIVFPLSIIAIFLLFFNKSSYAIQFTDSYISIKPRLLSRTKIFDLKKVSGVVITFAKKKDGFYDGSNSKHSYTTTLYYNIKITGITYQHTYKFKRKWNVSGLSREARQIKAIQMRDELETKIKFLKDFLPNLIEIQDIAPNSKITCQAKYVILCIDILIILAVYVQLLEGHVDVFIGGIILVLILTICSFLPQRKYKKYPDVKFLSIGLDEKKAIIKKK